MIIDAPVVVHPEVDSNIASTNDKFSCLSSKNGIENYEMQNSNLKEFNLNDKYLIFSGIGNHKTFVETVRGYGFKVQKDLEFPDHYNYKNRDLDNIFVEAEKLGCKILTTEKDYFRLENKNLNEIKFIKSDLKIIDEEKLLKSII